MGTYTANKELYMPTVGEQGWGTLVNGNFETIDNFLKPISLSGSTYTFTGNHVGNQSGGTISATSISNSGNMINAGTLTSTGKINANGGIDGKINVYESGSTDTIIGTCNAIPQRFNACPANTTSGTFTVYEGLLSDVLSTTQNSTVFNCNFTTYTPYLFAGYVNMGSPIMPGVGYSTISIYVDNELVLQGDGKSNFSTTTGSATVPININSIIKITYTAHKATVNRDEWYNYVELKSHVENFYL